MEVHHFTNEIILPKNELESDHTSRSNYSLLDISVGGGTNVLAPWGCDQQNPECGLLYRTSELVFSTNKLQGEKIGGKEH